LTRTTQQFKQRLKHVRVGNAFSPFEMEIHYLSSHTIVVGYRLGQVQTEMICCSLLASLYNGLFCPIMTFSLWWGTVQAADILEAM
jgi:hypothetical protein